MRTGKTTRLVDAYIQDLFQNNDEFLIIKDHTNYADNNRDLLNRITLRLRQEFPHIKYITNTFDTGKLLIKLDL